MSGNDGPVDLTELDAGVEHSVDVGQELVVRLPENRTTGFRWHLTVPEEGLALDAESFAPAAVELPGAGGTRAFRLRATRPGTHRLAAALGRPWEPGGPERTVEFTLHAR